MRGASGTLVATRANSGLKVSVSKRILHLTPQCRATPSVWRWTMPRNCSAITRGVAALKRCGHCQSLHAWTAEVEWPHHGAAGRLGQIDGETAELPIQTDRELRSRA
jgi:hypothetical protein